jgi:UDP-glucose 4-epimerase
VNSAGLFADEVAALLDSKMAQHRIYPVRGEYCELVREKQDLVRGLVYPMPHPDGLSLGLHLTKMTAVGVRLIVESPVRTIETNVYGTQLVLDFASKKKKLVFIASTSEVYGKSDKVPFREDADLVLGPTTKSRWSYAASKALDEFLTLSYWKEKKQPVIVGRLFNTVGPRQTGRYGMVLPNFVRQAQEGAPITVFGSGQQSRCFCDVRDTVEAILRLVRNDRAVGEVINVGSSEEISIEELAHVVKRRTNSESPITHIPYDQAYEAGFEDMPRRVPCLEKLERLTAFRPATPLSEIIDRVSLSLRHSVAPESAAPGRAAVAATP